MLVFLDCWHNLVKLFKLHNAKDIDITPYRNLMLFISLKKYFQQKLITDLYMQIYYVKITQNSFGKQYDTLVNPKLYYNLNPHMISLIKL